MMITEKTMPLRGTTILHREVMLACSQDDVSLATAYREIVRGEILPLIRDAEAKSYQSYTHSSAVTGGTIVGHGSFSAGLDAQKQARWQMLSDLRRAYERCAKGETIDSVPVSRSMSPSVRGWEVVV